MPGSKKSKVKTGKKLLAASGSVRVTQTKAMLNKALWERTKKNELYSHMLRLLIPLMALYVISISNSMKNSGGSKIEKMFMAGIPQQAGEPVSYGRDTGKNVGGEDGGGEMFWDIVNEEYTHGFGGEELTEDDYTMAEAYAIMKNNSVPTEDDEMDVAVKKLGLLPILETLKGIIDEAEEIAFNKNQTKAKEDAEEAEELKESGGVREFDASALKVKHYLATKRSVRAMVKVALNSILRLLVLVCLALVVNLGASATGTKRVREQVGGQRALLLNNGLSLFVYWVVDFIENIALGLVDLGIIMSGVVAIVSVEVFRMDAMYSFLCLVLYVNIVVAFFACFGILYTNQRQAYILGNFMAMIATVLPPVLCCYDEYKMWFGGSGEDDRREELGIATQLMLAEPSDEFDYIAGSTPWMNYFPTMAAFKLLYIHSVAQEKTFDAIQLRGDSNDSEIIWLAIICVIELVLMWGIVFASEFKTWSGYNEADLGHYNTGDKDGILLDARSLSKTYFGETRRVLRDVDLIVEESECIGLLGPNGAGKSTLCKILSRQIAASAGKFATYGRRKFHNSENDETSVQDCMGVCPQDTILFENLTCLEHIVFFSRLRGVRPSDEMQLAKDLLIMLSLLPKADRVPCELSGGMRRKLSIACCVAAEPGTFMLDEPTTGIDASSRAQIWDFVGQNLKTGCGTLLTTHMINEAESLCSRLVILRRGKVVVSGSTQELKEKYGSGYQLHIVYDKEDEEEVLAWMKKPAQLKKEYNVPISKSVTGQAVFSVGKDAKYLGQLFLHMDTYAKDHKVEHWGLTQANLEDAYLRIQESGTEVG